MSERKLQYGRFGLTENPIGLLVSMPYEGRTLLGEVVGCEYEYSDIRSSVLLTVRHFCGDPWPVKPVPSALTILEP